MLPPHIPFLYYVFQDPAQHFCRATSAEDKIPLPGKSISDLYTCPWHFFHVLLPLLHLNKNFHRSDSYSALSPSKTVLLLYQGCFHDNSNAVSFVEDVISIQLYCVFANC